MSDKSEKAEGDLRSHSLDPVPDYERTKLLPLYMKLATDRACAGVFGDLVIEVDRREHLQIMYETHLYRGIATSGSQLVWAPWPGDPDQDLPVCVEIRTQNGRVVFRQGNAATAARDSSDFSRGVREGLERAARLCEQQANMVVPTECGDILDAVAGRLRALAHGNAGESPPNDSSLAAQEGREQPRDAAEPPEKSQEVRDGKD